MSDSSDLLAGLSGETKALILIGEYQSGHQGLPELRALLGRLVSSDLERVGILELVRRQARRLELAEPDLIRLLDGLNAQGPEDTQLRPHQARQTRVVHRFDSSATTIPAPPPPPPPAAPAVSAAPAGRVIDPFAAAVGGGTIRVKRNLTFGDANAVPPPPGRETAFFGGEPGVLSTGRFAALVNKRVLLADDDKRIRMVFRKRLEDRGLVVEEAENGEVAWDKLQRETYAVLVLDMKMPGLHGLELLARLTAAGSQLPVIACSAYEQLKDDVVVATYPRLRYLVKPVAAEKLLEAVNELAPGLMTA